MKKLTEAQKQRLSEGLLDFMWKMNMSGKKDTLIKMYDGDPKVAKALDDLEKATDRLKKVSLSSKATIDAIEKIAKKY